MIEGQVDATMDVLESTHVLAPTERPTPLHPRQRVVRETEVAPERERLVGPAEGRAVVAHRRCPVRLQRIVTDEFLPGRQSFEFGDGLVEQTLIGVPWCNRRHDDREHYLRVGCLSRHCLRHEAPGSPPRRARAPAKSTHGPLDDGEAVQDLSTDGSPWGASCSARSYMTRACVASRFPASKPNGNSPSSEYHGGR